MTDRTQAGPARAGSTERCANTGCGHTKRDHSYRRDHQEKGYRGEAWCHACEATCLYEPPANGDGVMADFQDRGDAARRAAGIDGTAGDAQDIPHAFVRDDETGGCLLCGLAQSYRKHSEGAQR